MEQTFHFETGTTEAYVKDYLERYGYGSWSIASMTPLPHQVAVVVRSPLPTGPLSQRVLEEKHVTDHGLPEWAASYPFEPDSFWAEWEAAHPSIPAPTPADASTLIFRPAPPAEAAHGDTENV